jgi:hypothetical protein
MLSTWGLMVTSRMEVRHERTPPDPSGAQPADEGPQSAPTYSSEPVAPSNIAPSIVAAVKLMYVGAGLSLLGMLYGLATRDEIRDRLAEGDPDMTSSELDRAVNVQTGVTVVVGLSAVGLWLWMAQTNGRGLVWARKVATVLFGLNLIVIVYVLTQTSGFGVVVNIVSIALAGSILWLLYRKDSNAYYTVATGNASRRVVPPS